MTRTNLIITLILFSIFSCGQTADVSTKMINKNGDTMMVSKQNLQLDYIVFGVYCGMCIGHCATMYQYNMMGNTNTLLVDTTDSYFSNYGNVVCKVPINDRRKFLLAESVVKAMPNQLLQTNETTERFGCPDCGDGCGIYFEFKQNKNLKKFYIDFDTSKLSGDIKSFATFLKATLHNLNTK